MEFLHYDYLLMQEERLRQLRIVGLINIYCNTLYIFGLEIQLYWRYLGIISLRFLFHEEDCVLFYMGVNLCLSH
jgi:hypothetical protein